MNFRILLYWVVVSVPLAWGVAQSVNAALPLFGAKSAAVPGVVSTANSSAPSPTPTTKP